MKFFEKLLGVLSMVFMILSLAFLMPYASFIITIFMLSLSLLYFFLGFALLNNIRFRHIFKKGSFKNISTLRLSGTTFTGVILSMTIIYILFKFQRWPYGNQGLYMSLIFLLIILLTCIIKQFASSNKFYSLFLMRLTIIGFSGLFFLLIPDETLLDIRYRNYPEYVKAEKKHMANPENESLRLEAQKQRLKMNSK